MLVCMILAPVASATPLIVQNEGICYDLGFPIASALLFWFAACYEMRQSRLSARRDSSIMEHAVLGVQASAA